MKNPKTWMLLGLGTLILLIIGLYNGYPLVFSDTGTYIYSGFNRFVPCDRPITYGLFILLFSLTYSLWFVIVVQDLITAFVIYEVLKTLKIREDRFSLLYLFILTFLVFFTGIGWYSNQIMPDFFAPVAILSIFVLLKRETLTWYFAGLLSLILIYAMIAHFSHLMIGTALIGLVFVRKFLMKGKLNGFFDIPLKRIIVVSIVVLSGWVILPGINYIVEKRFILSKGSHVFLMAHLADAGILEKFLKENCGNDKFKGCKLCQYKDSIPRDDATFIWTGTILKNTGGWINSKEEYHKIIIATIKSPKYLVMNVYRSVTYGLVQLTKNEIGQGLSAYNEGSPPYQQIDWRFHSELNNYLNSRQNRWNGATLKLDTLNTFQLLLLLLSFFAVIYILFSKIIRALDPSDVSFLFFVLLAIIINSFITAGLNDPCERYQARVVWMLPLALIILIFKNYAVLDRRKRTGSQNG